MQCQRIRFYPCELDVGEGCTCCRPMSDHVRRCAVGAKKGTTHSISIAESGLLCDDIIGVVGVLHQRSRALQAQILHRLCRRLACFGSEGTAELAWREMRDVGKFFDA